MSTLGVVVVHEPPGPIAELPAVRDLLPQVDELLIIRNGDAGTAAGDGFRVVSFSTNRGTAAAWNAALALAGEGGHRHLYLLDQDSGPGPDAVAAARVQMGREGAAAVLQPAARARYRLDPFPWNTVASGSLYDVEVVKAVGGFDERLFVDEVDHELHARLMEAGHTVSSLPRATIDHRAGSPREMRVAGRTAVISGHSAERRRLQGYSAGLLVRRYLLRAPATAGRLLLRQALTMAKDLAGGEPTSARAMAVGLLAGAATGSPPATAAVFPCPYCRGPVVGRFSAPPGDVYRCIRCGALTDGGIASADEVASTAWEPRTDLAEPAPNGAWRRRWPTPRRRREMAFLTWYFTPPNPVGRFLEVGTGSGGRLVQFADAGWDVVGQDLDPKAGRVARDRGIDVYQCPVSDLVGRVAPFDLIGLRHVLEDAADPGEVLGACAALLAPGGLIWVISPNAGALGRLLFGRWWRSLEKSGRFAIPTVGSLERLGVRTGLETEHAASVATNAAALLGGSLGRLVDERLPAAGVRGRARFSTALLGQAIGRTAFRLHQRFGEEVVWAGRRAGGPLPPRPAAGGGQADAAAHVQPGIVGL